VVREKEGLAQVRALLVAVGGNCFEDWDDPIPQVGNRVMVMKYAGIQGIEGSDGRTYQICVARDITAILTAEEHIEKLEPRTPLGKPDSMVVGG
jgi:co-chaperonin GroES (HSP10)